MWLTMTSRTTGARSPIRRRSAHVPKAGSMASYVRGANPRSPDDGKGGRTWTPPGNRPGNSSSSTSASAGRLPPRLSG